MNYLSNIYNIWQESWTQCTLNQDIDIFVDTAHKQPKTDLQECLIVKIRNASKSTTLPIRMDKSTTLPTHQQNKNIHITFENLDGAIVHMQNVGHLSLSANNCRRVCQNIFCLSDSYEYLCMFNTVTGVSKSIQVRDYDHKYSFDKLTNLITVNLRTKAIVLSGTDLTVAEQRPVTSNSISNKKEVYVDKSGVTWQNESCNYNRQLVAYSGNTRLDKVNNPQDYEYVGLVNGCVTFLNKTTLEMKLMCWNNDLEQIDVLPITATEARACVANRRTKISFISKVENGVKNHYVCVSMIPSMEKKEFLLDKHFFTEGAIASSSWARYLNSSSIGDHLIVWLSNGRMMMFDLVTGTSKNVIHAREYKIVGLV